MSTTAPPATAQSVVNTHRAYRKVIRGLAAEGLRGVALDLPGTGLADRPADFDYARSGLAAWTALAIDALGIEPCHLVVHDIGGPIGFEWAIKRPDRVLSITALDTVVDVATFSPSCPMRPFVLPGVGDAWLALMRRPTWRWFFRRERVSDRSAVTSADRRSCAGARSSLSSAGPGAGCCQRNRQRRQRINTAGRSHATPEPGAM